MKLDDPLHFGWGARLPLYLQGEAAECGLACLAMIAGFHGRDTGLAELRRHMPMSLKGATLTDLVDLADRLGLAARPVRCELDELAQLQTPCLLHWDLNHFVVLKSAAPDLLVIHDPAQGVRRLKPAEASPHFTGVALELTPLSGFEPAPAVPRLRLTALLGRLAGVPRACARLFVLALAIELFAVSSPLYLQWVVDHALVAADRDLLLTLALGFALLLLLRTAITAARGAMVIRLAAALKVHGRANLFSHLLSLPAGYFEARHLGDIMSRFSSQETILQAITTDTIEALLDGVLVIVTAAIMFMLAPMLAMLVLAGAAAYGLLRLAAHAPLRQAAMEGIVWAARRDSHFLETLRGIKTIKLFNAEHGRRTHWLNLTVEAVNRQLAGQNLRLLFSNANLLLVGGLAILVLWLGAGRVLDQTMTIGMLLAFIAYKDQCLTRIGRLIDKAADLAMLRLHGERLADIALTAPEPRAAAPLLETGAADAAPVAFEARNLAFSYGANEDRIIDGVSLRVAAGEAVAIAGPSGCGKTTLLKIFASLLAPDAGDMLIDGVPLSRLGRDRWRAMIGVVMQDDQLFAGSIADNIGFFAERPDRAWIERCARLAALHDEIAAMPMGYDTLVGDMGTVLSGGQKQRLLIARALYRRPRLLLLDEATSHLDVAAEKAVGAALRELRITCIIVAHRPETLRSADRVIHIGRSADAPVLPRSEAAAI